MATVLRAQVETEKPGTVRVRAKAAPGHELDARPIGGFYVRRRFAGDEFKIAKPEDFSPRWMEFVDQPPKEWLDKISIREEERGQFMAQSVEENFKPPAEREFSMAEVGRSKPVQIDYRNGTVKKDEII